MSRATVTKRGRRSAGETVTIRRAEYERLLAMAGKAIPDDQGPPLPKPDAQGNFPAVTYVRASIARELIRRRKAAGLTQTALSDLAGVRQETISRIESGKHTVSQRIMQRIEQALESRRASMSRRTPRKRNTGQASR